MIRVCALALALFAAGAAIVAAPPQDRPGFPTQATMLVQNRGASQAIPVTLVRAEGEPLRVVVAAPVGFASDAVIGTIAARQVWEYLTVVVRADQRAAEVLAAAGRDGWEATGVQQTTGGLAVLLKRPAMAPR